MITVSKFVLLNFCFFKFLFWVQSFLGQAIRLLGSPTSFFYATLPSTILVSISTISDGLVTCPPPIFTWTSPTDFAGPQPLSLCWPQEEHSGQLLASISYNFLAAISGPWTCVILLWHHVLCAVLSQLLCGLINFCVSHYAIHFNCNSHHLSSSAGMQPSRRLIKPSRLAPKPSSSCLRLSEAHPGYVSVKMLLREGAGSYGGRNNE